MAREGTTGIIRKRQVRDQKTELNDASSCFEAKLRLWLSNFLTICCFSKRGVAKEFEKGLVFLN
jgi:hypothetical protein